MPDIDKTKAIPVPTIGTPSTAQQSESGVEEPYDLGIPTPTISRDDRYTAESPVSENPTPSIMVPTITLIAAELLEDGYLLGYNPAIPLPTISYDTNYTASDTEAIDEDKNLPKPTIELATRYTYVAPVSIDGGDHAIMVPTIGDPETVLYIYSPVDSVLAFDSPTYTDETTEANDLTANDVHLLPSGTIDPGDGILIGMTHPYWDRIRIDIGTAAVGTYILEWVYWNGSAWIGITGLHDDTNDFKTSGRNDVYFDQPTLWGKTTINGAERYWIFCRILTINSISVKPLGTKIWVGVISSYLGNTRQTMDEFPGMSYFTYYNNTPASLPKGQPFVWQFKLVNYIDAHSPRGSLNPTVYYNKDGAGWVALGESFSDIQFGWYSIPVSSDIANANKLVLMATAPGSSQCDVNIEFYE